MAAIIGGFVGGILAMLLLSSIISAFAFKSFEPHKRAVATVLTAWAIGTMLYGLNTGNWGWGASIYAFGALAAFAERLRRYNKHWKDDDHLTDVFR